MKALGVVAALAAICLGYIVVSERNYEDDFIRVNAARHVKCMAAIEQYGPGPTTASICTDTSDYPRTAFGGRP